MLKYKFIKPFSSFKYNFDISKTVKESWIAALHDPIFLTINILFILAFLIIILGNY